MQVRCENGIAFIDLPCTLVWFDDAGRHQESLDSERPVGEHLLAQFHRVATGSLRKGCDLDDTCRSLAIVQQAMRSFQQGKRLTVG